MGTSRRRALLIALASSLAMAQRGFDGPGRYEIVNVKSGKSLDLHRNEPATVIQTYSRGTDSQRWDVQPAGLGFYYIRNGMTGKALEALANANREPVKCVNFEATSNQQWRLEPGIDGHALIVSRKGRALDILDGSRRNGAPAQIYDLHGDANQRFILRRVYDDDREHARHRADVNLDRSGQFWDERDGACFYSRKNFHGDALCAPRAADRRDLGLDISFESMKLFGQARAVEVFERPEFQGPRHRITRSVRNLSYRVGSFRVN